MKILSQQLHLLKPYISMLKNHDQHKAEQVKSDWDIASALENQIMDWMAIAKGKRKHDVDGCKDAIQHGARLKTACISTVGTLKQFVRAAKETKDT